MRIRFAFAALLLLPASLFALDWSTHGPLGGAVAQIAISPAAPRVVYAAGGAGVFRSDDAGDTWRNVSGPFNAVTQLAVDPTNADVVFAATGRSVYKSTDGGVSWLDLTDHISETLRPSALFIDPADHSTIYLGSHCGPIGFKTGASDVRATSSSFDPFSGSGIFKSVDGGATWRGAVQGLDGVLSLCIEGLSLDPGTPQHLFVATFANNAESHDGAVTWTRATAFVPSLVVADHPTLTLTRYGIAGDGRFLRSTDGGMTWSAVATTGLPEALFNDLAIDPAAGRLFLATDRGVFRSGDGGSTWVDAGAPPIPTARVMVDRAAGYVFAATALGLFRAPANLGAWQQLVLADPSTNVRNVLSDPHDPSTVYSLIFDYQSTLGPSIHHGRIFVSHDNGNSWQLLRDDDDLAFASIAVDGAGDLYVHGSDGLFRYSSATGQWTQRTTPPAFNLAADQHRAGYLYAFHDLSPFFGLSSDGGATWQTVTPPMPGVTSVVFDPAKPSAVYAGGPAGVARSTDNGVTWSMLFAGDTRLLAIAPSNSSRLYRTGFAFIGNSQSTGGLFRSDDGGMSWTLLRWPDELAGAIAVVPDPGDAQSLWVASAVGRIFHSADGGATWQNAGNPVAAVDLAIAADGSRLHAATSTFGVWDAPIPRPRRRAAMH
ncbi:MAG TPA: hypothetical protein VNN08_24345 [Thermoanaerobaculia bacterium]|nr:hypothetical protein [Thermoanaerobaculia bacterium]